MNLSKLKYNSATMMPMGFFQQYRAHIINNASRAGDVITWNNNQLLHNDEIIGATFEGFILYVVIGLIDPCLTDYMQRHSQLKLLCGQWLMDVR